MAQQRYESYGPDGQLLTEWYVDVPDEPTEEPEVTPSLEVDDATALQKRIASAKFTAAQTAVLTDLVKLLTADE